MKKMAAFLQKHTLEFKFEAKTVPLLNVPILTPLTYTVLSDPNLVMEIYDTVFALKLPAIGYPVTDPSEFL
jgi:hypothetical protein